MRFRLGVVLCLVAAHCGAPPPPAVVNPDLAAPPSDVDPITGQSREKPNPTALKIPASSSFPQPHGPHLCGKGEEVAFACPIEADANGRQSLTSVCIVRKNGKRPIVAVKERVDGRTFSPFEDSTGPSAVSAIKLGGTPIGFEIRTNRAIYMVLRKNKADVDGGAPTLSSPGPTASYIRMLTVGPIETTPAKEGRCDVDRAGAITDNIEAFVKLAE